jgi:sphingolipid C9-methyltransferase
MERLDWKRFPWGDYVLYELALGLGIVVWGGWTLHTFLTGAVALALMMCSAFPLLALLMWCYAGNIRDSEPFDGYHIRRAVDDTGALTEKLPLETISERYFSGEWNVGPEGQLLETLRQRHQFSTSAFTWNQIRFFLTQFIPELLIHSRAQDRQQVTDHYDRGNDFYRWFLGPTMVYTSGIFLNPSESLEEAQLNKFEHVIRKIGLQAGMRLLDIGCGWGSFLRHAVKKYRVDGTGVTLSKEQTKWAHQAFRQASLKQSQVRVETMDFRQMPHQVYDRITCFEMAEHIGVLNFGSFLDQVSSMLNDNGVFYLQIAGLRRAWQLEDLQWGLFMAKYVFPGADASCPLGWVVNQLESHGFEVKSVETIGIHYARTLEKWYDNWKSHASEIQKSNYAAMYRKWLWFLAWSTIIAEQGSATCYQIVCHKNLSGFPRASLQAPL